VNNDYTVQLDGEFYQIQRDAIWPWVTGSVVRIDRRLDGSLGRAFPRSLPGGEGLRDRAVQSATGSAAGAQTLSAGYAALPPTPHGRPRRRKPVLR
jgi:hypothetical protein